MGLHEVDEGDADFDIVGLGMEEDTVLTGGITQLDVQLGLARVLADHLAEFVGQLLVELFADHGDGDALDGALLDILQVVDVLYPQVVDITVAPTRLRLGRNIKRGSLGEPSAPARPVLPEERQFASALEILEGNDAEGLAILREA